MLNKVKHLYSKDPSLKLRMTMEQVIFYTVPKIDFSNPVSPPGLTRIEKEKICELLTKTYVLANNLPLEDINLSFKFICHFFRNNRVTGITTDTWYIWSTKTRNI